MKWVEQVFLADVKEKYAILANKQKFWSDRSSNHLRTIWPDKKWQRLLHCSQFITMSFKASNHIVELSFGSQPGKRDNLILLKPTVAFFISRCYIICWPPCLRKSNFWHRIYLIMGTVIMNERVRVCSVGKVAFIRKIHSLSTISLYLAPNVGVFFYIVFYQIYSLYGRWNKINWQIEGENAIPSYFYRLKWYNVSECMTACLSKFCDTFYLLTFIHLRVKTELPLGHIGLFQLMIDW